MVNLFFVCLFLTLAVSCGYPPVKDDVFVKGSNFKYSSEGVLLRCKGRQSQQKPVRINCLSNSSWSVQDYSCSGNLHNIEMGLVGRVFHLSVAILCMLEKTALI